MRNDKNQEKQINTKNKTLTNQASRVKPLLVDLFRLRQSQPILMN